MSSSTESISTQLQTLLNNYGSSAGQTAQQELTQALIASPGVSFAKFCPFAVSGRPLPEISAVVRPSWVTGHPLTAVLPNRHVENARS